MPVSYSTFRTTQIGPLSNLDQIVKKHACTYYRRPIPQHQIFALEQVKNFIIQKDLPIIIDSGCGTGLSSELLAQQYPNHWVIGFDKSQDRLSRMRKTSPPNCLVVRADLIDMWRLLLQQNWPITHHFIFFPNPWPKASQVKRRFHAHPVFSCMIKLAAYLELRTNWKIYADEFFEALKILGHDASLENKSDSSYMTLFEKKYQESSSQIYIIKSLRPAQNINY